jgi:glycerol 3-phosphatase-2
VTLLSCPQPLAGAYDAALLDLDGVVYLGDAAIPAAPPALRAARANGTRVVFVTNNASRTPQMVAERLSGMGVEACAEDVVTSAQAVGAMLAERLHPGSPVLVVGAEGLRAEVRAAGMVVVDDAGQAPLAVVQGFGPEVSWRALAEAAVAVRGGAIWIAANLDRTLPSPRGPLPGNGSLVAVVRHAVDVEPLVAGKPCLPLHAEAIRRSGARRPLVVGDRLDTDIEGAVNAGCDSLLVLCGVSDLAAVAAAAPARRPSYLGTDLKALLEPAPEVTVSGEQARCRTSRAYLVDGQVRRDPPGLDADRAAVALCWALADAGRVACLQAHSREGT